MDLNKVYIASVFHFSPVTFCGVFFFVDSLTCARSDFICDSAVLIIRKLVRKSLICSLSQIFLFLGGTEETRHSSVADAVRYSDLSRLFQATHGF